MVKAARFLAGCLAAGQLCLLWGCGVHAQPVEQAAVSSAAVTSAPVSQPAAETPLPIDYTYTPQQVFAEQYDTEGLYPVRLEDGGATYTTYINTKGELVNPAALFAGATGFAGGFARAVAYTKDPNSTSQLANIPLYFYIDDRLNPAFGETFARACSFQEGRAVVQDHSGVYHVLTAEGEKYPLPEGIEPGYAYSGGRLQFRDEATGLQGFLDEEGQVAVPAQYGAVVDYSEGLAAVLLEDGSVAFINPDGEVELQPDHGVEWGANGPWRFCSFNEGLALVDGGFIDRQGRLVIECEYAFPFAGGRAFALRNGAWCILDTSGAVIASLPGAPCPWYGKALQEGAAFVSAGEDSGQLYFALVDRDGNVLTDFVYHNLYGHPGDEYNNGIYYEVRNGLVKVLDPEGPCYIDLAGNVVYRE